MPKKVYPERRMRDEHPWVIWKTLRRLKVMAKLEGRDNPHFSPDDIANVLYENWTDLTIRHKIIVLEAKLSWSIRFLKVSGYIHERMERPGSRDPDFSPMKAMDEYRLGYDMSSDTKRVLGDLAEDTMREMMDDKWGTWIGRKTFDYSKFLADTCDG